ncbi:hypothetical protein D1872_290090 [compost metagenome]
MDVQVKETGKIVTLTLIDAKNGINWAEEFVANWGALDDGQFVKTDAGTYLADQETVDWWVKALNAKQALEERISELKEEHGVEAVGDVLSQVYDNDLLEEINARNAALDEVFGANTE